MDAPDSFLWGWLMAGSLITGPAEIFVPVTASHTWRHGFACRYGSSDDLSSGRYWLRCTRVLAGSASADSLNTGSCGRSRHLDVRCSRSEGLPLGVSDVCRRERNIDGQPHSLRGSDRWSGPKRGDGRTNRPRRSTDAHSGCSCRPSRADRGLGLGVHGAPDRLLSWPRISQGGLS